MHIQYMRRIEIVSVIVLNIDSTFELNIVDVYVPWYSIDVLSFEEWLHKNTFGRIWNEYFD